MTQQNKIQLFKEWKVRTLWDDEQEKWYFLIVDVIGVLTDQQDLNGARNYWKALKHRLLNDGNETVLNCNQLKISATKDKVRITRGRQ